MCDSGIAAGVPTLMNLVKTYLNPVSEEAYNMRRNGVCELVALRAQESPEMFGVGSEHAQ